jgi:hypothetical protein
MAMVMARAYTNAYIDELAIFWICCRDCFILHITDELATGWCCHMMIMAYVCHLFACKLFVFLRFGCANLLKLACAGQFA